MNALNESKNGSPLGSETKYRKAWRFHEWNETTEIVEVIAELPDQKKAVIVGSLSGQTELMDIDSIFEDELGAATAGWMASMEKAHHTLRKADAFKKKADELRKMVTT